MKTLMSVLLRHVLEVHFHLLAPTDSFMMLFCELWTTSISRFLKKTQVPAQICPAHLNVLASNKERSISPADVRHGKFKGALGDCFQTGLRPSQDHLNPTGSGHAVATPTQRYICVCIIS